MTYVTVVEDDDDDEWVTFATVAGYTGVMIAWGCAVWGSGWYYPPYWGWGGGYPYYYPRYPTYGYGASYNPWTGAYGRGAVAYGPYGGAGVGARYNPRTGTYSRGAAAWGPVRRPRLRRGLQPAHRRLRPDAPGLERLRQLGLDLRAARRPVGADVARDQQPHRRHDARDAAAAGAARPSRTAGPGADSGVVRTGSGDVYAGRDGNVYRKQDGGWQKYDNGGWRSADRPTPGHDGSAATAARPGRHAGPRPSVGRRARRPAAHDGPAQPRLEGPLRGLPAHARLRQLPGQRRQPQQREHVPAERRVRAAACAAGAAGAGRPVRTLLRS